LKIPGDLSDPGSAERRRADCASPHAQASGVDVMRSRLPETNVSNASWNDETLRVGKTTRIGVYARQTKGATPATGIAAVSGSASAGPSLTGSASPVDERMSDWQVVLDQENASVAVEERDESSWYTSRGDPGPDGANAYGPLPASNVTSLVPRPEEAE